MEDKISKIINIRPASEFLGTVAEFSLKSFPPFEPSVDILNKKTAVVYGLWKKEAHHSL